MPKSQWKRRRESMANYRCFTAHVSRTGHIKLEALYSLELARWERGQVATTGGPEKARIIEQGLDHCLRAHGIDPIKLIRDPDKVTKEKVSEILLAGGAS